MAQTGQEPSGGQSCRPASMEGILRGGDALVLPAKIFRGWPARRDRVHLAAALRLAERFPDITRVYYCKDPFENWSWGRDYIRPLETRLLNNVDAVFAVSRLLTSDLAPRTPGKAFYLPNGFCEWFLPNERLPRPGDLPEGKPIVGCVGEINRDYDWDYISAVAGALPDVRICFIGKFDDTNMISQRWIRGLIAKSPNLLWLGWRKHGQLPAYMRHCDILMNFLKADDFGNRRSPLRLYDYLTTDRPIISTGVREAYEHLPHVHIAPEAGQAVELIGEILSGRLKPDLESRRRYIQNHTWEVRAREFLAELMPIIAAKKQSTTLARCSGIANDVKRPGPDHSLPASLELRNV